MMIGKTNASGASVDLIELKPLEISGSSGIASNSGFPCSYINDEPMTIWGQGNLVSIDRSFSFYPIRLSQKLPNRYNVPVTSEILLSAGYGKLKNGSYAVLFGIFDETDSIMGYFNTHNTQFTVTDGSITVTAGSGTSAVYSSTPYNETHTYKAYPMVLYHYM